MLNGVVAKRVFSFHTICPQAVSSLEPLEAIVKQSNQRKLTAKQVKEILIKTADKIGRASDYDTRGHSVKYGHGRVNADKAVAEAIRMRDRTGIHKPVVEERVQTGQGLFEFSVKRQKSEGYGVQIGVFAEYVNVLIQAEKLEKKFQKPIIVNIKGAQSAPFFILSTHHSTREIVLLREILLIYTFLNHSFLEHTY